MKSKKDVIVIGGGLGGLSAGAYLARRGYKVQVLEKINVAGGYVNTFKRKGYMFENSSHFISVEKYAFNQLGLSLDHVIPLDCHFNFFKYNTNNTITNKFTALKNKNFIDSLFTAFPDDAANLRPFLSLIKKIHDELIRLLHLELRAPFINIVDALTALCLAKGKKGSLISKLGVYAYRHMINHYDKNLDQFLESINDPFLKSIFTMTTLACLTVPPEKTQAIISAYLCNTFLVEKMCWIKGGNGVLIDHLINTIKAHGGEIRYKQDVNEIIIKNNKAIGVKTVNGDEYYADFIISNVNAYTMYNSMIKNQDLYPEELCKKLAHYQTSLSVFQVYLGLPFETADYGYTSPTSFFYNTCDTNELIKAQNLRDTNYFILTNYSILDRTYSEPGKSSIVLTVFSDFKDWEHYSDKEYRQIKREIQDAVIQKVKAVTGLPLEKAEVCFSATPRTLKYYSSNPYGGMLGSKITLDYNEKFKHDTPITNLFHVGADTQNGSGVNGALYSGIIAAKKMLK